MVRQARVVLWGQTVGAVTWDELRQRAQFQYNEVFTRSGLDVAPIMMPLSDPDGGRTVFQFGALNPDTFHGLPGLLADSLPDHYGEQLMNAWLREQQRRPGTANPVERLCYTGHRGMGALEYQPSQAEFEGPGEALEVKDLVHIANRVLQQREAFSTDGKKGEEAALLDIIRVGTSAGGARAKAVVAFNTKTGQVRSGQVDGLEGYAYCLIKFDGVNYDALGDPKGYGRIEYAYYLMARQAGIDMMPCRLLEEHGRAHFVTQRFDRLVDLDQGTVQKLHMATLCGIAHLDYNDPLGYSYEDAFQVMRLLNLPYRSAEELFRRMCFNVMARNHDDHTKNLSFLMDPQGSWHLAPAYDVTFAYAPDSLWLHQHQMSIRGKRRSILEKDMLALASEMNVKHPAAIIDEVRMAIENWQSHANAAEVPKAQINAIKKHLLLDLRSA